jgi:beta-lactamase class A
MAMFSPRVGLKSIALAGAGLFLLGLPLSAASQPPASAETRMSVLQSEIESIARSGAGSAGKVGVAAWRLDEQGPKLLINADEAFPMASTFKVAVAGAILDRIDAGKLSLSKMITIEQNRMIASPVIAEQLIHPGVALSIYNLLELMLTQSDNTATDYLLEQAGGAEAVNAWVRRQGVQGLRIDGGTDEIIRRFYGLGQGAFPDALAEKLKASPGVPLRDSRPDADFDADPRDTASPRAMGALLTRLYSGKALSAESTRRLGEIMARDQTGLMRLRGMMPPGVEVADKTGTVGGTINDVGVIALPNGAKVVIVVYIKASDASTEARERCIAQIGRSIRDFYLFTTP